MKYTRKVGIILILVILAVSAAGCVVSEKPSGTETSAVSATEPGNNSAADAGRTDDSKNASIVVNDMTGREVRLDAPAERIVVLDSADCEILYAIGAGNKIVGRGEYCDYPEEVNAVPSVQSGSETNIEQIIALEPQIVIMTKMGQSLEQVEALENAGIKVFASDAQKIEDVYTAIELIGIITGHNNEAASVIDDMKKAFSDIKNKVAGKSSKKVYFEVSPLEWGLWTAGEGTFMDELADILGLENIFSDVSGWAEISEEQVIERNPDYIVTVAMYFGEGPTPVEEIMGRNGWQDITAIKNGQVLNADSNEISLPGPRLAKGAATLYEFVYGDGNSAK
jgi:iron complex transport system substrate-binding protein